MAGVESRSECLAVTVRVVSRTASGRAWASAVWLPQTWFIFW